MFEDFADLWGSAIQSEAITLQIQAPSEQYMRGTRPKSELYSALSKPFDSFLFQDTDDEFEIYDPLEYELETGSSQVDRATQALERAFSDAISANEYSSKLGEVEKESYNFYWRHGLTRHSSDGEFALWDEDLTLDDQIFSLEHEIARVAEERRILKTSFNCADSSPLLEVPSEAPSEVTTPSSSQSASPSQTLSPIHSSTPIDNVTVVVDSPLLLDIESCSAPSTPVPSPYIQTSNQSSPSHSHSSGAEDLSPQYQEVICTAPPPKTKPQKKRKPTRRKAKKEEPVLAFNYISTNSSKKLKTSMAAMELFKQNQIVRVQLNGPENEDEVIDIL